MLNAFSVDVEDYFHVEAFASCVSPSDWDTYPCRVERNIDCILEMLERHRTRATFFVLGWVAERHPRLVRQIAAAGHEIGCHGYAHQRIHRQDPGGFRDDVRRARLCLMDQAQAPVECYRAPSFSITRSTLWALDVLVEEGFRIDSSIFPVRHDLYGIPDAERFPHVRNGIVEFPPTTVRIAGGNLPAAGGGYLRIFPLAVTRWAIRRVNRVEQRPAMVYFHPWELDPGQPRIRAPLRSRFRHYTRLGGMQEKVDRLLGEFRFSTVSDVCRELALVP
ncbi:MAG: DUF3473 domain-containing protein [Acidobacteriota bacterium]|jgi:polysaccharide deacetylase family protein (PEP-CTERM system associated)|nr:DUF3473 domain-containing protein [Acidobacteriota bacterium]